MASTFRKPDFRTKDLELRYENGEVCIYGTSEGLKGLISFCQKLLDRPAIGHIHLEDYEVLTPESEIGAIAIFPKSGTD